jgi:hypothetical protein
MLYTMLPRAHLLVATRSCLPALAPITASTCTRWVPAKLGVEVAHHHWRVAQHEVALLDGWRRSDREVLVPTRPYEINDGLVRTCAKCECDAVAMYFQSSGMRGYLVHQSRHRFNIARSRVAI